MAEAALKIDAQIEEYFPMRRMSRPDLGDMGPWLCKRIKEYWPHLQDRQILGWLQSCADSNEYFFAIVGKGVMLAQVFQDFTEPYPWVKEIFCFAQTDDGKFPKDSEGAQWQAENNAKALTNAAELYEHLIRWAQARMANEIVVDRCTDVPVKDEDPNNKNTIKKRMGRLFTVQETFARLDPTKVRRV